MNKLVNFIGNIFKYETNVLLGRWCHISIPSCCENVINRKIDFANSDNNFDINKINKIKDNNFIINNTNNNNLIINNKKKNSENNAQEYINYFSN
tara:strand:+ start:2345 stop:2629 length:285 start_codon:yes stop_codon:yes gene_type:complete